MTHNDTRERNREREARSRTGMDWYRRFRPHRNDNGRIIAIELGSTGWKRKTRFEIGDVVEYCINGIVDCGIITEFEVWRGNRYDNGCVVAEMIVPNKGLQRIHIVEMPRMGEAYEGYYYYLRHLCRGDE